MVTYPKILSLCTGYAGLDLGIRLAEPGARTVCMVEREAFAVANLVAKIEAGCLDDCPIWDNLETFDGQPWHGKVDCITAGIPCQPWSVAGKQQGIEDERWIWDDIYRIVREVRPEWFFVEEVRGFIRGGLGLVIRDLADIGYVGTYDIFRASDVGAPHRRERIFMLAHCCGSTITEKTDGREEYITNNGREIRNKPTPSRSAMADTESIRQAGGVTSESEKRDIHAVEGTGRACFWPTSPGQEQHRWEPPRVVADAASGNAAKVRKCQATGVRGIASGKDGVYPRQAQSSLGRNVDGCAAPLGRCECVPGNRVDELRLLGNGVLPLDAAVAWRTLKDRLIGRRLHADTE